MSSSLILENVLIQESKSFSYNSMARIHEVDRSMGIRTLRDRDKYIYSGKIKDIFFLNWENKGYLNWKNEQKIETCLSLMKRWDWIVVATV